MTLVLVGVTVSGGGLCWVEGCLWVGVARLGMSGLVSRSAVGEVRRLVIEAAGAVRVLSGSAERGDRPELGQRGRERFGQWPVGLRAQPGSPAVAGDPAGDMQ